MMKEAVRKRITNPFMEEDEHEAHLGALISEMIGVVTGVACDQSSGFHFSEVVAELGKGIGSFRQPVGLEDSLVKRGGREALDHIGGMEQGFHEAYHAGILNLDAGDAGSTGGDRQGQALKQGKVDVDVEHGCLKAGKAVIHRVQGFFHLGQLVQRLFEVKVGKVVA